MLPPHYPLFIHSAGLPLALSSIRLLADTRVACFSTRKSFDTPKTFYSGPLPDNISIPVTGLPLDAGAFEFRVAFSAPNSKLCLATTHTRKSKEGASPRSCTAPACLPCLPRNFPPRHTALHLPGQLLPHTQLCCLSCPLLPPPTCPSRRLPLSQQTRTCLLAAPEARVHARVGQGIGSIIT